MLGLQEADQKKHQKGCSGNYPYLWPAPDGHARADRTKDATDIKAREPPSRGCTVVVLYNTARPHSQIAWQTPAEFATTFNLRRSLALRYAKGSAPAPAASPAQQGTTHAGNELKTG